MSDERAKVELKFADLELDQKFYVCGEAWRKTHDYPVDWNRSRPCWNAVPAKGEVLNGATHMSCPPDMTVWIETDEELIP